MERISKKTVSDDVERTGMLLVRRRILYDGL
jgi:hypothetical protein